MRRFVLGISLLVSLLLGNIGIAAQMHQIHLPVAEQLRQAAELSVLGDGSGAYAAVQQAEKNWLHYRKFTAAFTDHRPLEEIDVLFGALESYPHGSDNFAELCRQLAERTEVMARSHLPVWWNLL